MQHSGKESVQSAWDKYWTPELNTATRELPLQFITEFTNTALITIESETTGQREDYSKDHRTVLLAVRRELRVRVDSGTASSQFKEIMKGKFQNRAEVQSAIDKAFDAFGTELCEKILKAVTQEVDSYVESDSPVTPDAHSKGAIPDALTLGLGFLNSQFKTENIVAVINQVRNSRN